MDFTVIPSMKFNRDHRLIVVDFRVTAMKIIAAIKIMN